MQIKAENKNFMRFNSAFYIAAKCLFLAATLLLTTSPSVASENKWLLKSIKVNYLADPNFNQPSGTEIAFTNGHVAKAEVINFKLIDYLDSNEGNKFIIFSGRGCTECDMNTAIYINAAEDKIYGLNSFEFPGTLKSFEDERLLSETRMFYGACLTKGEQVVVFYSRFLNEKNKWQQKVDYFNFHGNHMTKNSTELPYKSIKNTEAFQEAGKCFEVYGVDGHAEP